MEEQFWEVNAVAARFAVTPFTVRRWIKEGRLQGVKISDGPKAKWRVSETALQAFREQLPTSKQPTAKGIDS